MQNCFEQRIIKSQNRKEGEVLENKEFFDLFANLLRETGQEAAIKNREIDPERYQILNRAYEEFSSLAGDGADVKIKLHPSHARGAVVLRVEDLELSKEQLQQLKDVIKDCATFAIDPLTNGKIDISVTVNHVFKTDR